MRLFTKRIWKEAFGKYLFYTNVLNSGLMLAQGDLITQTIEIKNKSLPLLFASYDFGRTVQMLYVGFCQGPLYHVFYKKLDILFPARNLKTVLIKVFLDQTIQSPIIILTFFIGIGLFRHDSYDFIKQELKAKFLPIYLIDWILSPPTQFINFYKVPPQYRVLVVNLITIVNDSCMAYIKFDT